MTIRKTTENKAFLGVSRLSWIVVGFTVAWCCALFFMRQPPTPSAFDLPQARIADKPVTFWQLNFPATIVNCGNAGSPWCTNYCDARATVRYIECVAP